MLFESNITMVAAVPDGLYIGTESGLWWLTGPFAKMSRVLVTDHPVIPGTAVYVCADLADPSVPVGQFSPDKNAVMYMDAKGVCVGKAGGEVYNKSEERFWFPVARSGAAMFRRQDGRFQYVATLDSGGTPMASAASGDLVTATIRRGGAWTLAESYVKASDTVAATVIHM